MHTNNRIFCHFPLIWRQCLKSFRFMLNLLCTEAESFGLSFNYTSVSGIYHNHSMALSFSRLSTRFGKSNIIQRWTNLSIPLFTLLLKLFQFHSIHMCRFEIYNFKIRRIFCCLRFQCWFNHLNIPLVITASTFFYPHFIDSYIRQFSTTHCSIQL